MRRASLLSLGEFVIIVILRKSLEDNVCENDSADPLVRTDYDFCQISLRQSVGREESDARCSPEVTVAKEA